MSKDDTPITREARLAAKLRENLRRRKHQAKELAGDAGGKPADSGLSKPEPRG